MEIWIFLFADFNMSVCNPSTIFSQDNLPCGCCLGIWPFFIKNWLSENGHIYFTAFDVFSICFSTMCISIPTWTSLLFLTYFTLKWERLELGSQPKKWNWSKTSLTPHGIKILEDFHWDWGQINLVSLKQLALDLGQFSFVFYYFHWNGYRFQHQFLSYSFSLNWPY